MGCERAVNNTKQLQNEHSRALERPARLWVAWAQTGWALPCHPEIYGPMKCQRTNSLIGAYVAASLFECRRLHHLHARLKLRQFSPRQGKGTYPHQQEVQGPYCTAHLNLSVHRLPVVHPCGLPSPPCQGLPLQGCSCTNKCSLLRLVQLFRAPGTSIWTCGKITSALLCLRHKAWNDGIWFSR